MSHGRLTATPDTLAIFTGMLCVLSGAATLHFAAHTAVKAKDAFISLVNQPQRTTPNDFCTFAAATLAASLFTIASYKSMQDIVRKHLQFPAVAQGHPQPVGRVRVQVLLSKDGG